MKLRAVRTGAVIDGYYIHRTAGCTLQLVAAGAGNIRVVIIHVGIVDNGGLVDIIAIVARSVAMLVKVPVEDILLWRKRPPVVRRIIAAAERSTDRNAGTKRCPAIGPAARAPAHPGRPPFVARYPGPAVIIRIGPAAIVEWRPAPTIVRDPGVTILGIGPVSIGVIRPKIAPGVGYPYVTILRIVDPLTVRRQVVIKLLVRALAITVIIVLCSNAGAGCTQ